MRYFKIFKFPIYSLFSTPVELHMYRNIPRRFSDKIRKKFRYLSLLIHWSRCAIALNFINLFITTDLHDLLSTFQMKDLLSVTLLSAVGPENAGKPRCESSVYEKIVHVLSLVFLKCLPFCNSGRVAHVFNKLGIWCFRIIQGKTFCLNLSSVQDGSADFPMLLQ